MKRSNPLPSFWAQAIYHIGGENITRVESEQDALDLATRKYPEGCPDCDSDKVLVIRRERFVVDPKAQTVQEEEGAFYDYDVLCGNDEPCGFVTVE